MKLRNVTSILKFLEIKNKENPRKNKITIIVTLACIEQILQIN